MDITDNSTVAILGGMRVIRKLILPNESKVTMIVCGTYGCNIIVVVARGKYTKFLALVQQ
jgi:hypothetical protein